MKSLIKKKKTLKTCLTFFSFWNIEIVFFIDIYRQLKFDPIICLNWVERHHLLASRFNTQYANLEMSQTLFPSSRILEVTRSPPGGEISEKYVQREVCSVVASWAMLVDS